MHTSAFKWYIVSAFFLLAFASCDPAEIRDPEPEPTGPLRDSLQFLHLAHNRMNSNGIFNKTLTEVDFSSYDVLLLGGDLATNTSINSRPLDSLDVIFDLANENTLWALGNHDYDDLDLVEEYTGRPAFYTYTKEKVTFLVLDTQDSMSNFVGEQLEMIKRVVDTLDYSTHLVLLHHKLIWMYGNADLESEIPAVSNGQAGECFWCINPNNFYTAVYPLLLDVEERGKEVLCIGGDLGFYSKTFEYQTPEGIDFLGSGMELEDEDNPVLLLKYDFASSQLDWFFQLLRDL